MIINTLLARTLDQIHSIFTDIISFKNISGRACDPLEDKQPFSNYIRYNMSACTFKIKILHSENTLIQVAGGQLYDQTD